MSITYKAAGVDIEAGEETVNRIKPLVRSTFNDKVLTDIGLFGGFFDARFEGMKHPILVSSVDGVGTKLKIAFSMNKHHTVGHCLVNHCVNDILCCGARPLFFLDYFATGKLSPEIAEKVISGFVEGCKENGVALIGGETAEMPSLYQDGEYDMSGTIVGVVDKEKIVNGKNIKPGDVMIGLPSSGLHTNGYSLARAVLFPKYNTDQYVNELGTSIGEALLAVHRSYYKTVYPLVEQSLLTGISHITGGGLVGNTSRILPKDMKMDINWAGWSRKPIFSLIQKAGKIDEEEMRKAFNLGVGMVLITREENADAVLKACSEAEPFLVGRIV